jgi:predicted metal-binding membrane protein
MTSSGAASRALSPARAPWVAVLLVLAAGAWAVTVVIARGMTGMTGTMGFGVATFVAVWTLMMAAMMLPSVTPVASLYAKTVAAGPSRAMRLGALVAGYLLVWAAAGLPGYGLAWAAGRLAGAAPVAAHTLAVVVFAACGAYQFSGLKQRCAAHCRSPLALLLHYGSYRGRLRDLRAGTHHGAYCLGCCWALMVVLIAVGVMNLLAMAVLAAFVLVEKTASWGPFAGRVAGVAAFGLAVATVWAPWLAPGLHGVSQMTMQ